MNQDKDAWVRWYAVMVQIEHHTPDGWSGSRQVPLFYLDAHVQGIVSAEHATRVARDIVGGAGLFDTERVTFHITALSADQAPRWAHPSRSRVLAVAQAAALGAIVRAAREHQRVAWLNDDSPDGITWGTARGIGDIRGNHAGDTDDVRDSFLHVTTAHGWEAFLAIPDVIRDAQRGLFVTDYNPHPEAHPPTVTCGQCPG
jgi:hypothetical protein